LKKRNYRQAKRQKEDARKTRQLQKQQRRSERATTVGVTAVTDSGQQDGEPVAPTLMPES
jgi:hypothetical protein